MKHQIHVGAFSFQTKTGLKKHVVTLIQDIGNVTSLKTLHHEHFLFFVELCKRHPKYAEKNLAGIVDFRITPNVINNNYKTVTVVKHDLSETTISLQTCVTGTSVSDITLFNACLRYAVSEQTIAFKRNARNLACEMCGCALKTFNAAQVHVDHVIHFQDMVWDFMRLHPEISTPTRFKNESRTSHTQFTPEDEWIGQLFASYHAQNAVLRIVCAACNLTRPRANKN